ncbi:MAG: hypothetical protein JWR16_286 [Nevskia sp.]|nr:hypothetical protein [Nevskia sp.]
MKHYRQAGFRVTRRNRQNVRAMAVAVLDAINARTGWSSAPFPISRVLELWSAESGPTVGDHPPNFDVMTATELPHCDAEFLPHLNLILVTEAVWDAATSHDPAARWVLAHEVGHAVLRHHVAAGLYDDVSRVEPEKDSEHQANWFADELLMDLRLFNPTTTGTDALIEIFGVSELMAARRIRELILETRSGR